MNTLELTIKRSLYYIACTTLLALRRVESRGRSLSCALIGQEHRRRSLLSTEALHSFMVFWLSTVCFLTWCLVYNLSLGGQDGVVSVCESYWSRRGLRWGHVAKLTLFFLIIQFWITAFWHQKCSKTLTDWNIFLHRFENKWLRHLKTDTHSYMSFGRTILNSKQMSRFKNAPEKQG